jgi:hypothetical protein
MTDTQQAKPRRPRSWQEMRDHEIRRLEEQTGESLETWNERVREGSFADEGELRAWLARQGVTGYPSMMLVMERFGYPDYLRASADDLIEGQYADRPNLRPIFEAVLSVLPAIGEVEIQARKTYVALITPRRTFAAVMPTTRTRVDLGLRLTPSQSPTARLERARNFAQSSVTHVVRLTAPDDVDEELVDWLRQAYEVNI